MLDNSSQAVSMSGNDDFLSLLQLGNNGTIPVGQSSFNGQLQRFKFGELFRRWSLGVPWILHNSIIILVVWLHGWGWGVKGSSPDLYLLFSILLGSFCFVHASQTTIVTFVQAPRFMNWNTFLTTLFQDRP